MSPFWPFHAVASLAREALKRYTRSPHWRTVEKHYRARNPECAGCGTKRLLAVHHVFPFSQFPQLELDSTNLVTLCQGPRECHLQLGHLGRWKSWNPRVREDARARRVGLLQAQWRRR